MQSKIRSTLIFVSRVHRIKHPASEFGYVYRFRLLTPGAGSGSLTLTYPDKATAEDAQQTLLRAEHSHYVGNKKLFEAIWEALEALEAHVQSGTE